MSNRKSFILGYLNDWRSGYWFTPDADRQTALEHLATEAIAWHYGEETPAKIRSYVEATESLIAEGRLGFRLVQGSWEFQVR